MSSDDAAALTSKQRRRAEKRKREKEAKGDGARTVVDSNVVAKPLPSTTTTKTTAWNFAVDYNDHFETPLVAYEDLRPFLTLATQHAGKAAPADLCLYDPYFCQGQMVALLKQAGFPKVINRNRDFYKDIAKGQVPAHDVLVTNPPYSGEHKPRLLKFLLSRPQPFALLLPVYTATKNYWQEFVKDYARQADGRVVYFVPAAPYHYLHPEGTGKDVPPFVSAWFLGLPAGMDVAAVRRALSAPSSSGAAAGATAASVEELAAQGHVTISRRPNPKQRKKLLKRLAEGPPHAQRQTAPPPPASASASGDEPPSTKKKKKRF
jgi:hypothetical protein